MDRLSIQIAVVRKIFKDFTVQEAANYLYITGNSKKILSKLYKCPGYCHILDIYDTESKETIFDKDTYQINKRICLTLAIKD